MTGIDKTAAKVALISFAETEKGTFWKRKIFSRWQSWRLVGHVREYQVLYCCLPWQEKDFLRFPLEKQRQLLLKALRHGRKLGCVIAGVPMKWRALLAGNGLMEIPSAKELSLEKAIAGLGRITNGLKGREIAVFGVNDPFAKTVTDRLLADGVKLILNGSRAAALSEWYYRNQGLAVPVFRTEKAGEAAEGILSLNGTTLRKYEDKTICYQEFPVFLAGVWQVPFAKGCFPAGLAAALLSVGAEEIPSSDRTVTAVEKNQQAV